VHDLTYEIVMKKFLLGRTWNDTELVIESLIDMQQFSNEGLQGSEHPVTKKLAAEREAAEIAGNLQELLNQWHQEVLPYVRYQFKLLYKYFGDSEVKPLWQRYPQNFRMSLNTEIACLEQTGPLLADEIAEIVQALRESIGHEKGVGVLYDTLGEVGQKRTERLAKRNVEG